MACSDPVLESCLHTDIRTLYSTWALSDAGLSAILNHYKSSQWGDFVAKGFMRLFFVVIPWKYTLVKLWGRHDVETRQIWGIWKLRPTYSPESPNLGKNRWYFVPCDLEIWWMTLENNRASLLCYFKLCATFHSHCWIQTWVTFRKRPIWVKIEDFF